MICVICWEKTLDFEKLKACLFLRLFHVDGKAIFIFFCQNLVSDRQNRNSCTYLWTPHSVIEFTVPRANLERHIGWRLNPGSSITLLYTSIREGRLKFLCRLDGTRQRSGWSAGAIRSVWGQIRWRMNFERDAGWPPLAKEQIRPLQREFVDRYGTSSYTGNSQSGCRPHASYGSCTSISRG